MSGIAAAMALLFALGTSTHDNILHWKVQNQRDIYGYLVYRSENPDGPFVRLNAQIVRAGIAEDGKAAYTYVDPAPVGKTYYYRIDSVSTNGMKRQISPVLEKAAGISSAHLHPGSR